MGGSMQIIDSMVIHSVLKMVCHDFDMWTFNLIFGDLILSTAQMCTILGVS